MGSGDSEVGSLAGTISMMLTVLAMPFLMAKFGEINFATLGITRYKLKSNFLKGAICGTLLLSTVTFIILLFYY